MKYVKSFESHRKSKLTEPVNEELFGGIINFFKGLWSKAMEELKKLGKDPDTTQVKDWIGSNPFNPADNNYLFKNVMDEFKKKLEANDQDALTLVDNILNPETGVLAVFRALVQPWKGPRFNPRAPCARFLVAPRVLCPPQSAPVWALSLQYQHALSACPLHARGLPPAPMPSLQPSRGAHAKTATNGPTSRLFSRPLGPKKNQTPRTCQSA